LVPIPLSPIERLSKNRDTSDIKKEKMLKIQARDLMLKPFIIERDVYL
jgi:hypothetical protein